MMTYDDSNLQKLFEELEPRRRNQALRGAFRKTASFVRAEARRNLASSGINTDTGLPKGIRSKVFKKQLGFRVTVGTGRKDEGMHTNKRGLKKPVLMWAELGTKERYTKSSTKFFTRKKKGHFTGRMKTYGFMAKTKEEVKDKVTDMLHDSIVTKIQQTAKKYGCH